MRPQADGPSTLSVLWFHPHDGSVYSPSVAVTVRGALLDRYTADYDAIECIGDFRIIPEMFQDRRAFNVCSRPTESANIPMHHLSVAIWSGKPWISLAMWLWFLIDGAAKHTERLRSRIGDLNQAVAHSMPRLSERSRGEIPVEHVQTCLKVDSRGPRPELSRSPSSESTPSVEMLF